MLWSQSASGEDSHKAKNKTYKKLVLAETMPGIILGNYLALYKDESARLTYDEAQALYKKGRFVPSTSSIPSYGISKAAIWAALIVENPTEEPISLVLSQRQPTNSIQVFSEDEDGLIQDMTRGSKEPQPENGVDYYLPTFELSVAPGRHEIFIRLSSLAPTLAFFAWDHASFDIARVRDLTLIGGIFGAIAVMVFFNLLVYLTSKQVDNLFYILYLMGFSIHQLYLTGFSASLLGSYNVLLIDHWLIFSGLSIFCALEFTKRFLNLKPSSLLIRIINVVRFLPILVSGLSLVNLHWAGRIGIPTVMISFSLIIYAGIRRSLEGYRPAYYFAMAWVIMFACGLMVTLTMLTILPINSWSLRVGPFGVLLEMVLLSLAIGEKVKVERDTHLRERDQHLLEQEEHFLDLSSQNRKIQHAFSQMQKVFFPHQVHLIEGGVDLENTMPTGKGEACVICFDIIGSSKIQHEKTKEFFSNVFRRCNDIMMEGYKGEELISSAYRIKEMGDGFLCSVGYPFKSRSGHMSMDALKLAYRYFEAFSEGVKAFGYRDPIHCCIGIALDNISGFFPEVGTKEYDLYGRGIVLATRYENMRKTLFANPCPTSVLIIHERVYLSLSEFGQKRFVMVDLRQHGLEVRDDPDAKHVYFCVLDPNVKVSLDLELESYLNVG